MDGATVPGWLVLYFWTATLVAQAVIFRVLRAAAQQEVVRPVRDTLVMALKQAVVAIGSLTVTAAIAWVVVRPDTVTTSLWQELQLLGGFFVLALGLSACAVRLVLRQLSQGMGRAAAMVLGRGATLLGAAAYGYALVNSTASGLGGHFLAVLGLGVCLLVMGLNRTADLDPGVLSAFRRS